MLGGTLTAGAQAAHQTNAKSGTHKPSVVVVGAGLIGSSVAMHLAKHGCKVTVVEASQPASGQGSMSTASRSARLDTLILRQL